VKKRELVSIWSVYTIKSSGADTRENVDLLSSIQENVSVSIFMGLKHECHIKRNKLRGLSPRANYTDQADRTGRSRVRYPMRYPSGRTRPWDLLSL
jgi:hypothetical protein